MARNKRNAGTNRAIGGALTPTLQPVPQTSAPQSFSQFVAAQSPAAPSQPATTAATSNPFVGPTPSGNGFQFTPPAPGGQTSGPGHSPAALNVPDIHQPPTNPVGMLDPALYAAFVRHKYWMDNAKNRGDDTANYGAGPMRTMAF